MVFSRQGAGGLEGFFHDLLQVRHPFGEPAGHPVARTGLCLGKRGLGQRGRPGTALVLGEGAAVGKYATYGRRLPGDPLLCLAGRFAAAPAGEPRVGDRDGVEEEEGVRVTGVGHHLFGRAFFDDDAVEHDDDPAGPGKVPHHSKVVADEDVSQLAFGP